MSPDRDRIDVDAGPRPDCAVGAAGRACASRRDFLLAGGSIVTLAAVPGALRAAPISAVRAAFPRARIGRFAALRVGAPVVFTYPYPGIRNLLVKLGAPAGGGIGVAMDVVAFNLRCTHLGGPLDGTYQAEHQVLGPCPLHLTTFDLTRHGMVVSGHATESLPQIVLDSDGDDIHAIGVQGLVWGRSSNHPDPGGTRA